MRPTPAVPANIESNKAGVRPGYAAFMSAMIPETCGAAMLVPWYGV
jgi:hypothetical protein